MRPVLAVVLASCSFEPAPVELDPPAPTPSPSEPEPEPEPDPGSGHEPRLAWIVDTHGTGLNLRAGASTLTDVVAVMPEHAVVEVEAGADGAWWPVDYQGLRGWAFGAFLEVFEPGVAPPDDRGWNFLLPWPAATTYAVTQGHDQGTHTGTGAWAWDFGLPRGTPILASHGGVVRLASGGSTTGGCSSLYADDANFVVIDRGDGLETLYLHLDSVAVQVGEVVSRGQVIGASGQTGWACGAHLHFQIQLSPDGGGGETGYNPSVQQFFWDTGTAVDPPLEAQATSANDTGMVP